MNLKRRKTTLISYQAMNNKINIGLVQVGDCYGGQYFFPYSIGVLQAYAEKKLKNLGQYEFLLPIYKRLKVKNAVDSLLKADIVFFSTYLWNFRISLEIARQLKEKRPDCIIVFGGPQVPDNDSRLKLFLTKYRYIDIGSFGEGEQAFVSIIENFLTRQNWKSIPSIGYLSPDGQFVKTSSAKRISNLNDIPSPYLEGVFDTLIQANPKEKWSAMFETNRGCPYTCTYCAWGTGEEKKKLFKYDLERILNEIDWFSNQRIEFLFCCDANFGILNRDIKIAEKVAENKNKYQYPMSFSIQNTKNSSQRIFDLQKVLNDAKLQKGVNLALQSVNPETLKHIHRANIDNSVYQELQKAFANEAIPTFSDLILGLPGETYKTFSEGVADIIESGQHNRIQFINLSLLENTAMAEDEYINQHGLVLQESQLIPHHTNLSNEEVIETQTLVVGTDTMPKSDWIKTRVFGWLTGLLHFNKILQIPFIYLNIECKISFKDLVEIFLDCDRDSYSVVGDIVDLFFLKAKEVQAGEPEHIWSDQWLDIWWPVEEYIFIRLVKDDKLTDFYFEAESILKEYLNNENISYHSEILHQCIKLNQILIKRPFIKADTDILLDFDILSFYSNALKGEREMIKKRPKKYSIDRTSESWESWDDWLKQVVWFGTKKGNFLYSIG